VILEPRYTGFVMQTATSLLEQLLSLPENDRAEVAARLLESLEPAEPDVDAAWAAEIDRRCAALDRGEAVTSDWNDFRVRIERDVFGR
jgi:putative addiction module component (TIGR02574 family)